MKHLLLAILLAACGSKNQTPVASSGSDTAPPADTRTEIEKRRDAACETLGPKMTACAVEDSKAELDAGSMTQKQYDEITAPEVKAKNTEQFVENCKKAEYSSRQVRVLEVCQREESECDPLLACLDNLKTPQ
jgi:hypothetical protein